MMYFDWATLLLSQIEEVSGFYRCDHHFHVTQESLQELNQIPHPKQMFEFFSFLSRD